MNTFFRMAKVILLITCCVYYLPAQDEICVPPAGGVPYSPGAPNWWVSPAPTTLAEGAGLYNRIDDPRWLGAASITYDNGVIDSYHFRALYKDGHLLLSFMIKKILYGTGENRLYLALSRGTSYSANGVILFEIFVNNGIGNNATPSVVVTKAVDATPCTTGVDLNPAYEAEIKAWDGSGSAPGNNYWGVNLRLPLDTPLIPSSPGSISIPSDGSQIFIFYEMLMGVVGNNQITFSWPRGSTVQSIAGCDLKLPEIASWKPLRIQTPTTTCPGGITIDRLDIGTNHPSGTGYISRSGANTFFANPQNNTGAGLDSMVVHARFRIANWGIQPATTTDLSTVWQTIPGLEDVQQTVAGTVNNGMKWNLNKTLPAGTAFFSDFDNVTKSAHQCMMVELYGADLYFERSSVYRNMNFIPTSEFTEEAEINVKGLPVLPDGENMRDIYLHVQTQNMPEKITAGVQSMPFTGKENINSKLMAFRQRRNRIVDQAMNRAKKFKISDIASAAVADSIDPYTDDQLEELILAQKPLSEHIATLQPTYMVHGYYNTGYKIKIADTEYHILKPMTSFGYFPMHEGAIEGWKHQLSSSYASFEEIAQNWYKISTGSTVKISVTIASIAPECNWWLWIILLLILIMIVIVIRVLKGSAQ